MHQKDPHEWTIERLTESFPVDRFGVKKILKSSGSKSLESLHRLDKQVDLELFNNQQLNLLSLQLEEVNAKIGTFKTQEKLTLVTAFEIGSRGYISTRNHSALYSLHKFVKPGVKLAKFKQNISALAVYSSFHIFITRKEEITNVNYKGGEPVPCK